MVYLKVVTSYFSTKFLSRKKKSLSGSFAFIIYSHALKINALFISACGNGENERIAERSESRLALRTGGFAGIPNLSFTPGSWHLLCVLISE
jgi:hypothetical protein